MVFEFPLAALVGLAALPAVGVLLLAERRASRLAGALGLRPPRRRARVAPIVAVVLAAAFLAAAAAQPVASAERGVEARTDAEVAFVVDVTQSMAARARPGAPTRLDRARAAALDLRARIREVPAGVASLTDRVLPHLFPTPRTDSFTATIGRTLAVGRPVPSRRAGGGRATSLEALSALATGDYFSPSARHRVAVVLTDGESLPVTPAALSAPLRGAGIVPIFVHVWAPRERIFRGGRPDPAYVSDPGSRRMLEELGPVFGEGEREAAVAAVRAALGQGPTRPQGREAETVSLAPYAVAAAGVPLLLLLWSRNLWPGLRRAMGPAGTRKPPGQWRRRLTGRAGEPE